MARTLLRIVLLSSAVLALAIATPAFAAAAPDTGGPTVAGCASGPSAASLFADLARQSSEVSGVTASPGALAPVFLELGAPVGAARPFHGHCHCSCSFVPDCNTSADCGGSPCLAGVTCC